MPDIMQVINGLTDPYSKQKLTPLNREENTKQNTVKNCDKNKRKRIYLAHNSRFQTILAGNLNQKEHCQDQRAEN